MKPVFLRADAQYIPLPDKSVHTVIDSPPYLWQRFYSGPRSTFGGEAGCSHEWQWFVFDPNKHGGDGVTGSTLEGGKATQAQTRNGDVTQAFCKHCSAFHGYLGLEPSVDLFITHLVNIFREVKRVLRDDGHLFVNLDDKRSKDRQWLMVPERFVLAMVDDGWRLEDKIVWQKRACMPSSARNRFTHDFEPIFMFNKSKDAYFDIDAVREKFKGDDREIRVQYYEHGGNSDPGGGGFRGVGGYKNQLMTTGRSPRATWHTPHARLAPDLLPHELEMLAEAGYIEMAEPQDDQGGDVWTLKNENYPGEHYAAFSSSLPERAIRATTSERGCCRECGKPWVRETELTPEYAELLKSNKAWRDNSGKPNAFTNRHPKNHPSQVPQKNVTTGWRQVCDCPPSDPIPCTVLDPFGGTGTTAIVASLLGRRGIALDISGDYIDQAKHRYALAVHRSQNKKVRGKAPTRKGVEAGAAGVQERLL